MHLEVNQVVKTENGEVLFQGKLTQEEADYIVSIGLNILLHSGSVKVATDSSYVEGSKSVN